MCGILCANYSTRRGGFKRCEGFWCGKCYCVSEESNRFPVKTGVDMGADGAIVEDPRDKGRFLHGRPGDHLMHEFQCDLCHFRNVRKINPSEGLRHTDGLLLECIRRCNLDSMWSKEPTTIERNRRDVLKTLEKGRRLGLASSMLFRPKESRPLEDECAMGFAATMIIRSLDKGKNEEFVQFNTVRSMRAAYSNYWRASGQQEDVQILMRGQTKLTGSTSPTNTIWFENFMTGFHKRVGDVSQPDKAISIELMCALMRRFEKRWNDAKGSIAREKEVLFPALFSLIAYTGSLRGEEVPLMDLEETRTKTWLGLIHPTTPHVVISLTGRFKNELGVLKYHVPLASETDSGLKIKVWLERMLEWYGSDKKGYVFRNSDGGRVSCGHYAQDILSEIQKIQRSGLPEEIGLVEADCDVFEEYGMSRSFRRGSDSRALAAGVPEATVELMNRWRVTERAKGRNARLKMSAHYSDVRLLLGLYLPYSKAL